MPHASQGLEPSHLIPGKSSALTLGRGRSPFLPEHSRKEPDILYIQSCSLENLPQVAYVSADTLAQDSVSAIYRRGISLFLEVKTEFWVCLSTSFTQGFNLTGNQ